MFVALQLRKSLHRPHRQPSALDRVADLADKTRRLGRRDGGNRRLFLQQQHVGLARVGEAIGDRASDGAAADDHDFCVLAIATHIGSRRANTGLVLPQ